MEYKTRTITTVVDGDRPLPDYTYDHADQTWCRLCFGSYGPEELVQHETDGTPPIGPACVHCLGSLMRDATRRDLPVQSG